MPAKIKILLIEDDQDDIDLLKVALEDNRIQFEMETLIRGDMILKWLEKPKSLPDVIILDLNLPKLQGKEVLCKIKENSKVREIPVVVLTTSASPFDKEYCMNNGADRFYTKPSTMEGFNELVDMICSIAGQRKHA